MKLPSWLRRPWRPKATVAAQDKPLREFVYLDEVSLRSLLSSQRDGVAEASSRQVAETWGVEGGTQFQVGNDVVGKVKGTSNFQTSNSSTLQTSRKATVQSWFRELHEIPGLRLMSAGAAPKPFVRLGDLKNSSDASQSVNVSRLTRGELIEMRVRLTADPIFKLVRMISELTEMAEDFPERVAKGLSGLSEATMANRIFDRLLAGLIPIRAEAVDYVVVEVEGEQYIAHRRALDGLDLEKHSLTIVGVTEHLAYWKDIRRVLFSDAEFTILCRISRDGLQTSWTPVKLADLFNVVVPDLVKQMNAAGRYVLNPTQRRQIEDHSHEPIVEALQDYKRLIVAEKKKQLSNEQDAIVEQEIARHRGAAGSPRAQRDAFNAVRQILQRQLHIRLNPDKDLELRERARKASGLTYLPRPEPSPIMTTVPEVTPADAEAPLLDVEVVAIYW